MDAGKAARERGALRIAGLDEVGRGPLFGPVVAAAVILPGLSVLHGLTDSKKLSEKKRVEFDVEIRANAVAWAIAAVDAETIDRINIRQASLLAMRLAVEQLALSPTFCSSTAATPSTGPARSRPSFRATRPAFRLPPPACWPRSTATACWWSWTREYPGYGLAQHKGYCSPEHLAALARLGPTPLHRKSFSPVAQRLLEFPQF